LSPIGAGHQQLGQLLLQAGVIDELQLRSALGHQRQWGGRLGRILLELKFIDEGTLAATLAKQLGLECQRISADIDRALLPLVPQTVAERYWIFPVAFKDGRGGGELTVAVADPTNLAAVEDIRFHTGKRIRIVVAPESDIEAAIKRFYYGDNSIVLPGNAATPAAVAAPQAAAAAPEAEEEMVELEPITGEEVDLPVEAAPGADPLAQYFDGMSPSAPVSEATFDFSSPVLGAEAAAAAPAPPPAVEAPPPPLQIGGSAFDSPYLAGIFDTPTRPGGGRPTPPPPAPARPPRPAPPAMARPAIPTETQPVVTLVPADAIPPELVEPAARAVVVDPSPEALPAEDALAAAGFDAPPLDVSAAGPAVDVSIELTPPPPAESLVMTAVAEPMPGGELSGEPAFDMAGFEASFEFDATAAAPAALQPPQEPEAVAAVPEASAFAVAAEVPAAIDPSAFAVSADVPAAIDSSAFASPAEVPATIDPGSMVMSAAAAALAEPEAPPDLPIEAAEPPIESPATVPSPPPEPPIEARPPPRFEVPKEAPKQIPTEPQAMPAPLPAALDAGAFTESELQILDSLEARVATGGEPPQIIKPGELVSALIRLMIRRGLLSEAELIEELQKR